MPGSPASTLITSFTQARPASASTVILAAAPVLASISSAPYAAPLLPSPLPSVSERFTPDAVVGIQ
ncbi:hypothetical protein HMPREF1979_01043 [Actinomyces johnsonii F0542]|uniref:Uncharacterized protein n=1 Tax=Actinomyces johnsonii F0542 TaxID=1321818 RepID=U1RYQ6_9ACTO|nr:hypothetical protein HMPREF1979_01043 [Actinomyces johnsonii F0542]